jgi:molybdopterin-containing oxidoreductase family membrane subunit
MSAETTGIPKDGRSLREITSDLINPVRDEKFRNKLWTRLLMIIIVVGLMAYIYQLFTGLGVTAMRDYSSWGMYIGHFVFLVAVSLVGSLVTAVLKLLKIGWATPLTRIAEIIAVAAVALAAVTIIIDMGRPDRVLNIFLHGRIQSPIVWDVTVVNMYLIISVILLYLPMIPDIAIMRDTLTDRPKWQQKMYKVLSLNWKGTEEQWKLLKRAIYIMLIVILPVAFAIHTVTSWLFAVNSRAGWDSTIFGPYFVSGAFMVGAAAVIAAMYIFIKARPSYKKYITRKHFNMMGKLLFLTGIIYFYFNINEFLVPGYKMQKLEGQHLLDLFVGHEAPLFWATQVFGMILPLVLLVFKPFRKPLPAFIISLSVIIFAWTKRMLIVIPTQFNPTLPIQNVPESWSHYIPTYYEIVITSMTIAIVLLIITWFAKFFPIIPVWEVAKENGHDNPHEKVVLDEVANKKK